MVLLENRDKNTQIKNLTKDTQIKVLTKRKFGGLLKKVVEVGEMVNFRQLDQIVLMTGVQVEFVQATEIAYGFLAK